MLMDWVASRVFRARYFRHVHDTFDRLLKDHAVRERHDVNALRMVVFSDHHRGDRTGADDFRPCEETYLGALEHYLGDGYKLVLLGDVEELWEATPKAAVASYEKPLAAERLFADEGRYIRVWGNHDDAWSFPDQVRAHLAEWIGNYKVQQAVEVSVTDADEEIGRIFLAHGHQGTWDSDRGAAFSRFVVRWMWRPVQRLFRISLETTPSKDFSLRFKHEVAMHEWAQAQERLLLVTGHTHHPVFCSHSHESQLEDEIARLEKLLASADFADPAARKTLESELDAARRSLAAKLAEQEGEMVDRPVSTKPCYFNAGCCSYPDGDITGLELADGEIRLVRWHLEIGKPAASEVLCRAHLREVFSRCSDVDSP